MVHQAPHVPHRRVAPPRASPIPRGPSPLTQLPPLSQSRSLHRPAATPRYVDTRFATRVESPIQDNVHSPMARKNINPYGVGARDMNGPLFSPRSMSRSSFKPLHGTGVGSLNAPDSPYGHRKTAFSPSMMSFVSDDTDETASLTLDTSSRMGSPVVFASPPFCRVSPRPHTPTGRSSPFAKNDDDPSRKNRVKTEMCMHYVNNRPCPFGANCTYAHGEEELQMTKLLDLERAGLVDLETFRTKPCLTWVMTGSCPFGSRCTCIHDPRVSGTSPSWLTHTETQGNTIATDINVESMHQKRLNEVHSNNPFGHQFSLDDDFSELYKLICNINVENGGWVDPHRRQGPTLVPIIKIQIALAMRGNSEWCYKFRPQHIIHDEMCMVLQHRAFQIDGDRVIEIPLHSCRPRSRPNHVEVRELAFGPDSDDSVREVALWFNIDESNVVACTPAQSKRYRYKKGASKRGNTFGTKITPFSSLDRFDMIRPNDAASYDLATDILKHRLAFLRAESISAMRERHDAITVRNQEKEQLKQRFQALKRHWKAWGWPVNDGREKVNRNTTVPKVDGKYEFPRVRQNLLAFEYDEDAEQLGRDTRSVWLSLVNHTFDIDGLGVKAALTTNTSGHRLRVFQLLAAGLTLASDRSLPLICDRHKYKDLRSRNTSGDKERCWRAILLKPETEGDSSEWDLVRDHFENSRSNRVLNIIQSKSPGPVPGSNLL